MKTWILLPILYTSLFSTHAFATNTQNTTPKATKHINADKEGALQFIERQMIHLRWNFWKGLQLFRDERPIKQGLLGSDYQNIFAGSPRAIDLASRAHNLMIGGIATTTVGLVLILSEAIIFPILISRATGNTDTIFIGFTVSALLSLTTTAIGSILLTIGRGLFFNAVEQYNKDLLQHGRTKTWSLQLGASPLGVYAGLKYRF